MKNLTYLFHSRFGKYLKLILIFCAAFLTGRLLAKITSSEIISPDITALSVSSDPSGNWGLSFQEKGKQPLGNASIQEAKISILPLMQDMKTVIPLQFWMP